MENNTADLLSLLKNHFLVILLGFIGLILVIYGGIQYVSAGKPQETIVIEKANEEKPSQTIVVDIQGAVAHPGVYEFKEGDRVKDALSRSGGLTTEADKPLIAKTMNLASLLQDGMKLYFPFEGEQQQALSSVAGSSTGVVSINTASASELEALSGIGEVTARKVIDNRPYSTIDELVVKKVISQGLFEKLKDQLSL